MLLPNPHRLRGLDPPLPTLSTSCTHHRSATPSFLPFPSRSTPTPLVRASGKKFRGRRRPSPRLGRHTASPNQLTFDNDLQQKQEDEELLESEQPPREVPNPQNLPDEGGGELRKEIATTSALRGSDILLALQKAAAQKRSNIIKKGNRREVARREETEGDDGDLRPLEIKEDWGSRVEELEKLIQELQAQQHFYDK